MGEESIGHGKSVPLVTPAEGIQNYMREQVQKRTPANFWWRSLQWTEGGQFAIVLAVIAGSLSTILAFSLGARLMLGLGPMEPTLFSIGMTIITAILIVGLLCVILEKVLRGMSRAPGEWKRHSLAQIARDYPDTLPYFAGHISKVRTQGIGWEFEVAVLEGGWSGAPQGFILFLTIDSLSHVPSGKEQPALQEKAVCVLDHLCRPVTLGGLYGFGDMQGELAAQPA
jgi:hypothetical protein